MSVCRYCQIPITFQGNYWLGSVAGDIYALCPGSKNGRHEPAEPESGNPPQCEMGRFCKTHQTVHESPIVRSMDGEPVEASAGLAAEDLTAEQTMGRIENWIEAVYHTTIPAELWEHLRQQLQAARNEREHFVKLAEIRGRETLAAERERLALIKQRIQLREQIAILKGELEAANTTSGNTNVQEQHDAQLFAEIEAREAAESRESKMREALQKLHTGVLGIPPKQRPLVVDDAMTEAAALLAAQKETPDVERQ